MYHLGKAFLCKFLFCFLVRLYEVGSKKVYKEIHYLGYLRAELHIPLSVKDFPME